MNPTSLTVFYGISGVVIAVLLVRIWSKNRAAKQASLPKPPVVPRPAPKIPAAPVIPTVSAVTPVPPPPPAPVASPVITSVAPPIPVTVAASTSIPAPYISSAS